MGISDPENAQSAAPIAVIPQGSGWEEVLGKGRTNVIGIIGAIASTTGLLRASSTSAASSEATSRAAAPSKRDARGPGPRVTVGRSRMTYSRNGVLTHSHSFCWEATRVAVALVAECNAETLDEPPDYDPGWSEKLDESTKSVERVQFVEPLGAKGLRF